MADLYDFVGRIPAVDTLGIQIFAGTPTLLRLPMAGSVSSLNVSVATGICLFEALRQRSVKAKSPAKKK